MTRIPVLSKREAAAIFDSPARPDAKPPTRETFKAAVRRMNESGIVRCEATCCAPMTRGVLKVAGREYPATFTGPSIPASPVQYVISYRLADRLGATTPEDAAGAMRDRGVLQGMGATEIRIVEVKR